MALYSSKCQSSKTKTGYGNVLDKGGWRDRPLQLNTWPSTGPCPGGGKAIKNVTVSTETSVWRMTDDIKALHRISIIEVDNQSVVIEQNVPNPG